MDWLQPSKENISASLDGGRRAHAYLISGPRGVGKRALAGWLLARVMGTDQSGGLSTHPDVHKIVPEEGKARISVEQIRALAENLALASMKGGTKAALIEPADAMTTNAANALLKTLEEPAGDSCLVLVADRLNGVPATVLSRCIHLKIPRPSESQSLAWLRSTDADEDWGRALGLAHGAPLKALALRRQGLVEATERCELDFSALLSGETDALRVAQKWKNTDHGLILDWLMHTVDGLIRLRMTRERSNAFCASIARNVLSDIDTKNLFCYLDRLKWLNSQPKGTYNEQLALESLLLAWSDGLRPVRFESPLLPIAS